MLLDTNKLIEKSLKAIKLHRVTLITEVPIYIGISTASFYNHKLHEVDEIVDAVNANKIRITSELKTKWFDSTNATLQIALYKLICSEDDAHRLNATKQILTQEINHTNILQELEEDD